jgi:hypothetical protein
MAATPILRCLMLCPMRGKANRSELPKFALYRISNRIASEQNIEPMQQSSTKWPRKRRFNGEDADWPGAYPFGLSV